MAKTLRLLKVIVQPILVIDDGESLREVREDPKEIAGSDWGAYPERFQAELSASQAALDEAS